MMNQYTLIYFRNISLFLLIGSILGLGSAFVILDNIFTPSTDGFAFIVNNLEMIIDPEIKRIVSDNNLSDLTDEQQIIEKIRTAQEEGNEFANNLMSFFLLYAFGALCSIFIPVYLGVKISMRLSNKWFPINRSEIQKRDENL